MRGNGFASFPCSHSRSLAPSVFHQAARILGQTMDFSSRKSVASQLPGQFRHNSAQPFYWIPSRAPTGLKTTPYGTIAGKKPGQDSLVRDSDKYSDSKLRFYENRSQKGLISALSISTKGNDKTDEEKVSGQVVTVFHEDSDSESEEEGKNLKKKHMDKRLKGMQGEVEDSESDSDDEKKKCAMKKSVSNCKVEVVGMSNDDSDSESDSDEEKEMKKKIKADEKELKKQAKREKKEMKALKKIKCKDSDRESKNKEEKKTVSAVYVDEDTNRQDQFYVEEPDSDSSIELEGEQDDVVAVVPNPLDEDDNDEEDFELVGDEDLSNEIENEIEDSFQEYEDEELDDDFWEDDEGEAMVGDGGDGGGVVLGDAQWQRKAFDLAEVVVKELGSDFAIYAFKASPDSVRVRLDKLSDQYGSPTMTEIEAFSRKYTGILDSSEIIPEDVAVEVSSPGAERMLKIPDELERFKQLPMYVQYFEDEIGTVVNDGVLELDSFDPESGMIVWKLANVKLNREQAGKGRPLNSKQKKWRAHVPLKSHKLVRLYLDV